MTTQLTNQPGAKRNQSRAIPPRLVAVPDEIKRFIPIPNFVLDPSRTKKVDPWKFGAEVADGMVKFLAERYGICNEVHSVDVAVYATAVSTWLICRNSIMTMGTTFQKITDNGSVIYVANPDCRTIRLVEQTLIAVAARYGMAPAFALDAAQTNKSADIKGASQKWITVEDDE